MGAHCQASRFWIMALNSSKQHLVMSLPAQRTAADRKDMFPLLAQQINNRIHKGNNKIILGGFCQGKMKIIICGNIGISVGQAGIHNLYCVLQDSHMVLCCALGGQSSDFRFKNLAYLNQMR